MEARQCQWERLVCGSSRSVKHGGAASVNLHGCCCFCCHYCVSVVQHVREKEANSVKIPGVKRASERKGNRNPSVVVRFELAGSSSNTNNKKEAEEQQEGEET